MANSKKSRQRKTPAKQVSEKTRLVLWTLAAGRCQYRGCNQFLLGDLISGKEKLNRAYIAHIVADSPGGPRGDPIQSPQLVNEVSNLMLLCDTHHRLIDKEDVAGHPVVRLQAMKAEHEKRIESVAAINAELGTTVLIFAADIGENHCPVKYSEAKEAVLPKRYPSAQYPIELNIRNYSFFDDENEFWTTQVPNLQKQFKTKVAERIADGSIQHLSVFGLAPQPLLIELGHLLCDITSIDVFNRRREPTTWKWLDDEDSLLFDVNHVTGATGKCDDVALKFEISAHIDDGRVREVMGSNCPIWTVTTPNPHNDCIKHRNDLMRFRQTVRKALNLIKSQHGDSARLHIFPAMPASAAIELGRVRMPKADLPFVIYEQNRANPTVGFLERHRIG